jgi:predicted metallopeptidase
MRFDFWTQYMVELGRSRFDELEAQYRESVTILEDEAEHIDHDRLVALKRAHDERVAQLYRELTLMTINQYLPR